MNFDLNVRFPDEKQMEILVETHTVRSDISDENRFPSPGDYFLAAVASCTAANARAYCLTHQLPAPLEVLISAHMDDSTEWIDEVQFSIVVTDDFPAERREALIRAAETCWVKQLWQHPPTFSTRVAEHGAVRTG
jgi:uncharacterized OsmC-like protein